MLVDSYEVIRALEECSDNPEKKAKVLQLLAPFLESLINLKANGIDIKVQTAVKENVKFQGGSDGAEVKLEISYLSFDKQILTISNSYDMHPVQRVKREDLIQGREEKAALAINAFMDAISARDTRVKVERKRGCRVVINPELVETREPLQHFIDARKHYVREGEVRRHEEHPDCIAIMFAQPSEHRHLIVNLYLYHNDGVTYVHEV